MRRASPAHLRPESARRSGNRQIRTDSAGNLSIDWLERVSGYNTALGKARLNADGTSEFPMKK